MPQLRKDPITGRWVIVNIETPKTAFAAEPNHKSTKVCPFCPGNESMTPPEILVYGRKSSQKDAPGWRLRVIPNKFPALRIEESNEKSALGIYDRVGGFGAHEVIVESPDHDKDLAELPVDQVEMVLRAYRERCLDLRKDARLKYILLFKNYGQTAGASLEHPHSQLIALPIVPSRVQGEIKGSLKHFERTDRCLFCDILDQEKNEKKYTILTEGDFVALAPFAARFPFESWILPETHHASFDTITDDSLRALAGLLKAVLTKIKNVLHNPSYNFMIHTLPIHGKESESFHWHIEIIPHLTQVAGFELGTGFYVNPTPPELSAQTLKTA